MVLLREDRELKNLTFDQPIPEKIAPRNAAKLQKTSY